MRAAALLLAFAPALLFAEDWREAARRAGIVKPSKEAPRLSEGAAFDPGGGPLRIAVPRRGAAAGLLVANGGLETAKGCAFDRLGLAVTLLPSDEELVRGVHQGGIAACVATVETLAYYGSQLNLRVPLVLATGRYGTALAVVARARARGPGSDADECVAAGVGSPSEWFLRRIAGARGAGRSPVAVGSVEERPDRPGPRFLCCTDAEAAADLFLRSLAPGAAPIDSCVTWLPLAERIAAESGGAAGLRDPGPAGGSPMVELLAWNAAWAQRDPERAARLVEGILEAHASLRADGDAHLGLLAGVWGCSRTEAKARVDAAALLNGAENSLATAAPGGLLHAEYAAARDRIGAAYLPGASTHPATIDWALAPEPLAKLRSDPRFRDETPTLLLPPRPAEEPPVPGRAPPAEGAGPAPAPATPPVPVAPEPVVESVVELDAALGATVSVARFDESRDGDALRGVALRLQNRGRGEARLAITIEWLDARGAVLGTREEQRMVIRAAGAATLDAPCLLPRAAHARVIVAAAP